jgi:hypothetical protein
MSMSSEETKFKTAKKMVKGHSQPGTSSTNIDEALGNATKKKTTPAHVGFGSTSDECESLGGIAKKKPSMVDPGGAGDAAPYMR